MLQLRPDSVGPSGRAPRSRTSPHSLLYLAVMPLPRNRQPKPKRAPKPPTTNERVDPLPVITGPQERRPRTNGSPFRPLDGAPDDIMLERLLSPPGFGEAWDALPPNATPRDKFIAHHKDVALIFDPVYRKEQGCLLLDSDAPRYRCAVRPSCSLRTSVDWTSTIKGISLRSTKSGMCLINCSSAGC